MVRSSGGRSFQRLAWWIANQEVRGRNLVRDFAHLRPLANSAMMSTLTVHYQWEDDTVSERTGHSCSYAEARKMNPLTLYPWLPFGYRKGLLSFLCVRMPIRWMTTIHQYASRY